MENNVSIELLSEVCGVLVRCVGECCLYVAITSFVVFVLLRSIHIAVLWKDIKNKVKEIWNS